MRIVDLGDEVVPQKTIEELRIVLGGALDAKKFADIYFRVENYINDIGHALDDMKNPFPMEVYKKWEEFLLKELHAKMVSFMEEKDVTDDYSRCNHFGYSFGALYGYVDGNGWWCVNDK